MLISAFVFGGIPEGAVKKAFIECEICVSPQLLQEYRDVPLELRLREKITQEQLKTLLSGIASLLVNSKVVYTKKSMSICRDAEDNMILECCFAAEAVLLITGDKDLLEIDKIILKKELPKLKIVSPRIFLQQTI